MAVPSIPTYTGQQLEQIAAAHLQEHYPSLALPIDVEYLVEKQGFDIREIPGIYALASVRALPIYYKGIAAICIDLDHSDRYPELARFTLAEELGHLLLHKPVFEDCSTLERSIERYLELPAAYIDRMDRNARYFGAAILVPERCLRDDLEDFLNRGNVKGFSTVNEARVWLAETLCRKYRVSSIMLGHRLRSAAFWDWSQRLRERLA